MTNSSIRIGTLADPGAAAAPGLGAEFFDTADAFIKWCNAAGGINGRKIILTKRDAKLFEGAAQVINACQGDFMLVGGGNAFDAPDVKPRLACKLGQIPAYTVSPEAAKADLQVSPAGSSRTEYAIGPLRLLADAYPAAKSGLAIGGVNVASLLPQGRQAKQAYESLGYKVSALQERPPLVDNFRPYMEELKNAGAKAYYDISSGDPSPELSAMDAVGWKPDFLAFGGSFYTDTSVAAAKSRVFPPTYVGVFFVPFELADKYPVVKQIKAILAATVAHPDYDYFTALAFNAWALWAKSATECGPALTQDCVLQKAGRYSDWTAGGLFGPTVTTPGKQHQDTCIAMMRLTPDGFVYDKAVTKPTRDIFNCSPANVAKVDSFD